MAKKVTIALKKPDAPRQKSKAFMDRVGKGRPKGAVNKTTKEVKEVIAQVFENIGGIDAFGTWAKAEKTEFYKMYAKLLPIQLQGAGVDGAFQIIISKEEANL